MQYISQSWTAQVALSSLAAFGVCYATGRFVGEEESAKKKERGRGGPPRGGGGAPPNQEAMLNMHYKRAEELAAQGRFAEAETHYSDALDLLETINDPFVVVLESVFSSRLAACCEKQQKYEEAEKYYLRCISTFEGRPLSPQELLEYNEILERTVEFCMSTLKNPDKAVRPLTLWLKVAEDLGNDHVAIICCNLLTKIKHGQGKMEDAFQVGSKALALVRKKGTMDEVGLSTMFQLTEVYHQLGKHDENRKLIAELAVFASSITPPQSAANVTASLAGWCFDHDYYVESQNLMARAIELSTTYGNADKDDLMMFENTIAQALAERGMIDEARVYTKKIASMLGSSTPPLTISKYLKTIDTIVVEREGIAYCNVKLLTRELNKLPSTALLVCRIDNPAGGAELETQQMIEADRPDIEFNVALPFALKGYIIAQIDVYTNATKIHRISSHFVLCQSESDIRPASYPSSSSSASSSASSSLLSAESAAAPLNFVEHHVGDKTVIEATVGDTTIVGTTDGTTTVIAATDGDTTVVETISGDAVIKETFAGDIHTIEGTDGVETIRSVSDGTTTVLERQVGDYTEVEVIANTDNNEEEEEQDRE